MTVLILPIAAALAVLASACSPSVETAPTPAPVSTSTFAPEELIQAPSCAGDLRCGSPAQSCCASPVVEGGTFNRYNDPKWPATVSSFRLDAFEVTVGRLRVFVEAYPDSRPKEGDGAHPKLPWSGWRSEWDEELPGTQMELRESLRRPSTYEPPLKYDVQSLLTWFQAPNKHERSAANNITWYVAFAFCAWDGGRLPTEAEWSYASVGGEEQRPYPWGAEPPDQARAVLNFSTDDLPQAFLDVGSKPMGEGRFGQLDLGGNRLEWALDAVAPTIYQEDRDYPTPCFDCAKDETDAADWRVRANRSFMDVNFEVNEFSLTTPPSYFEFTTGIRCARDLP